MNQRWVIKRFLEESQFNHTWNWFTMINQIVSKYTSIAWYSPGKNRLFELFSRINENEIDTMTAKMKTFKFIFIFLGIFLLLFVFVFLTELICSKVRYMFGKFKNLKLRHNFK